MSAPSPVPRPPDVRVGRSGGLRAIATNHSVRRYVERSLGIGEEALAGLDDAAAVEVLFKQGKWLVPRRDFNLLGVFEVKIEEGPGGIAYVQTFVTPRGMTYIAGLLKKRDLKREREAAARTQGELGI